MDIKKYISLDKLDLFHSKLIAKMSADDDTTLSSAKKYTDDELTDFATETNEAIDLLTTAVESKADKVHTHTISQVDGLQAELNTKETKGASDTALASAKLYTDSEVDATLASAKSYTDTEVASALSEAKSYTDTELAELINGAPTTLDTLGEIATAMAENEDVVEALNKSIGSKANASDLTALQTTVSGKADAEHTHEIADITGLQDELDEKAGLKVEGKTFYVNGVSTVAETGAEIFNHYGNNKATGKNSHAEGHGTTASGNYSHAEGYNTKASGNSSHTEGCYAVASGDYSHAEGYNTKAFGDYSHAKGSDTIAFNSSSYAEGIGHKYNLSITGNANTFTYTVSSWDENIKIGRIIVYNDIYAKINAINKDNSTIIVSKTLSTEQLNNASAFIITGIAFETRSHSEGNNTTASGQNSHSEGHDTTASGTSSHSEGCDTIAYGSFSHSEGYKTTASGSKSHAEGYNTIASGESSHAEGDGTTAYGNYSHAEGISTIASSLYQHVQGKYNIEDSIDKYAHIVGNGKENTRSNAHTLDWNGNAWFAGTIKVGGTGQDDTAAVEVATKASVEEQIEDAMSNTVVSQSSFKSLPIQTATTEGQTTFVLDDSFNISTDTLVMVQSGITMLYPNIDFTFTASDKTVVLSEGVPLGRTIGFYVMRNEIVTNNDFILSKNITYGTTDLESGVSSLATGKLYLVLDEAP